MFIFLLIMVLLLPVCMILMGRLWQKNPPKDVNGVYGYRTSRSMSSKEAWDFAHRHFGKFWFYSGLILFVFSILGMLLFKNDYENASIIFILLQTIVTIIGIFPTEAALKKNFDKYGYRK